MSFEQNQVLSLQAAVNSLTEKLMPRVDAAIKQAEQAGEISQQLKREIDPLATELNTTRTQLNEIKVRLGEAEKLYANVPSANSMQQKSQTVGSIYASQEAFKTWAATAKNASMTSSHVMEVEAAVTSFDGNGNQWTPSHNAGLPKSLAYRFGVRDLLDWVPVADVGSVEFAQETSFTNGAAPAPEGTLKGESNLVLTPAQAQIVTIAHHIDVSKQSLSDSRMLAAYIDTRLAQGLKLKEEEQLLKGSGVSANINGMMTQATAWANQGIAVSNETALDRLRIAMLQIELQGMYTEGFVLHPADWTSIELLKDTSNKYLFADPFGQTVPVLWGLPVVSSLAQTQGQFLAGAFRQAATGFDRELMKIEVFNQNKDNAIKNMVTILCEERIALAVHRPKGFVKGALASAG